MSARTVILITSFLVPCGAAAGADAPSLRLYLPRSVLAKADALALGSISVIRCKNDRLAKKAAAVAMGRAPWPKETIIIDRRTILSRLASSGIPPARVRITGAEKVSVRRNEKVISTAEILGAAGEFLEKNRPGPAGGATNRQGRDAKTSWGWRLSGRPKELVVPAADNIKLKTTRIKDAPPGYVKVQVAAVGDGRTLAGRTVMYKLVYPTQRAVATEEILPGEVITKKNAKLETALVDRRPAPGWNAPYGKIATRPIRAGTIIQPGLARDAKPALVIRRNQSVLMRVQGFGFIVTAIGQALQDGRRGDFIKVRNVDTRRIVTAKVTFDGTVEPMLKR